VSAAPPVPERDLDEIAGLAADDLRALDGRRLLLTGGTGFVGTWLLEALVGAAPRLGVDVGVAVLTRDPDAFAARSPHLATARGVELVRADVLAPFPALGAIDGVVHAATPASAAINEADPRLMVDTIVDGMRHALAAAAAAGSAPLLFTSSGAVYGRQPPTITHVDETYLGGPDPLDPRAAYHEGKRLAELLGAIATATGEVPVTVGRLFAFVGPHLPIDAHFAVGNFLRDALAGAPIVVGGDGTPLRSYLYPTDMVVWLLALLVRGTPGRAVNVGSEDAVSIREVAEAVAAARSPRPAVEVRGVAAPGVPPERYVPSTVRARVELGLSPRVPLDDAIRRTLAWHDRTA
jgi:nucleoside-diphosphate-sugar epimerase